MQTFEGLNINLGSCKVLGMRATKIETFGKTFFAIAASLLVSVFVFASPAHALTTMSMGPTNYCSSNCMSQHTTTVKSSDETRLEEQDQEPEPPSEAAPYYANFENIYLSHQASHLSVNSLTFRPPDLTKLYVNFRN